MSDNSPTTILPSEDEDEISLLDLLIALGEEKLTLLMTPLLTSLTAVAVVLWMTPTFTAKTVIMPPQQSQSAASSALASLGALAGLAGGAAGIKTPDEMYIAFMQSESLQNSIIQKLQLQERYEAKTLTDTRAALKNSVKVTSDKKSGLLTLEADDKDPVFAAQLANLYVDELRSLLSKLAVTEAQQRRVFYDQEIKKVQQELGNSESIFRDAKQKSGMQVTAVLAESGVRASAELRAQIASREVQLQALSRFATPQNPDMQKISSELSAMRAQLKKLEQGEGQGSSQNNPTQQIAVQSYRDIKVQEAKLDILIRQYELARIDEAKEGPLIQQLDVALPPERKSKPKRMLIVLIAAVAGFFAGVLIAFIKRALRLAASNPDGATRLLALKRAWGFAR
jgi:uncharacterized protein involved in exopolysaccharide biosynthesis